MKVLKRVLSMLLVFCMVITLTANVNATETSTGDDGDIYKIVHLDCGRKYFSPENIKKIIDNAAGAGFNQVELYLSDNQGFRLALDDMNVTTSTGNTYDLTPALGDGYSDGSKCPDGSGKYLTQTEMTGIISYAKEKGIDIVPCINVPGHMGAILEAFPQFKYSGSDSSIDLENNEAVAFALAITEKYAVYFASQGVKYYNLGADEYANDMSTMGFQGLYTSGKYQQFVNFINSAAEIIIKHDMTPRVFNDGICYNNDTSYNINKAIEVCYWSSGWDGYGVASAATLSNAGYKLINTHGDYYWVLGNSGWQCSAEKASGFDYTSFQGGTVNNPAGAMFCIWCDVGNANGTDDGAAVVSATADVMSAFGAALPVSENSGSESGGDNTGNVEVTENKNITVTVGQTATATIEGTDYSNNVVETELDKSVATVSAKYEQAAGGTEVNKVTSITSGQAYLISDGNGNYLTLSGSTIINSTDPNTATKWTITKNEKYEGYYTIKSGNSTLSMYNNGYGPNVIDTTYTTWSYDGEKGIGLNGYYLYYNNGWKVEQTSSSYGAAYTLNDTEPVNATTVTFSGVKVGTTYVTVGNTRYTINVIAEDLSTVTPITIEYWITNVQVTGSDNAKNKSIKASAEGVYSEEGTELSTLVPATGTANGQPDVFWKGTRLDSDNKQTTGGGVDKTTSGTDFVYIRYWNGAWSYSADRENWTNVVTGDQLVAYYLQKTTVTDEVTTYVVDWGPDYDKYTDNGNYVLLDFAVKYESGERVPTSFPNTTAGKKTIGFHCDTSSTNLNKVTFKDGDTYYRHIGMIKGEETADYEIYMITLTPTSDTKTTQLSGSSASANSSYTYGGTEKVVWVDDEANLNTDLEKHEDYHVGGDPIVPQLKIYNKQGMLVTYYVHAKVTEDSLSVHYIDQIADQEFYNYNIAVNSDTVFNEGIGLADPWKANLKNGSVRNLQGNIQNVSADLSTMPAIGAQYRYSDYTCVNVERGQYGKDVYLYYTFNNAHSFVADFGLPLTITSGDLNISGDWTNASVTDAKYGTATVAVGGGLKYTPTKTFGGVETLQLTLSDSNGSTTHQIYIYPATTVYYEEGFASYTENWDIENASKGSGNQATSVVGAKVYYGYDSKYAGESVGASNETEATSSTIGDDATFTFTGTGVDIYANCTTESGSVSILIRNAETNAIAKLLQVDTSTGAAGSATIGQGVDSYSLPIASVSGLDHGTYTVTIRHSKTDAGDNGKTVSLDGFRVYDTLVGDAANAIYAQDNEANPNYLEMRNAVLTGLNVDEVANSGYYTKDELSEAIKKQVLNNSEENTSAVIFDNSTSYTSADVQDLLDNGPKNEVFLRPNQTLAFKLVTGLSNVQIGLKAATGKIEKYSINVGNTKIVNDATLTSSTDMFYKLADSTSGETLVTITNTSGGILSVTDLKFFGGTSEAALMSLETEDYATVLMCMNYFGDTGEDPEPTYADASLTVQVADTATTLTKNGVVGEAATFTADEIKAAAETLVADGYNLNDAAYTDIEVAYGQNDTVTFTASEDVVEPEPANIFKQIIDSVRNFFGKIFGRR